MKPVLLVTIAIHPPYLADLQQRFDLIYAPDPDKRRSIAARLPDVQVVLTNGTTGFSAEEIDSVPKMQLLSALGVGHEKIDVTHAKARGVVVSNGAGTNDSTVADHAMALLLSTIRRIPVLDRATREGIWRDALQEDPGMANKRVGIVGLGRIGEKIARRAVGFDCEVGYYSRTRRDASPYRYFDDVLSLAAWCDFLMIATPGGADTRHLIDAAVLSALGANGFVVNISRGSVVDTDALAHALTHKIIAGAGLDVYESEPKPPASLLGFDQVVLTPHVAGRSPEAVRATIDLFVKNTERHFNGEAVTTPL